MTKRGDLAAILGIGAAALLCAAAAPPAKPPPAKPPATGPMAWAYPAAVSEKAADGFFRHQASYTLPGSRLKLTEPQLDDPWAAVDWLPAEHPPAPAVVLHGRKPDVMACGLCHMTNGQGGHGVPALAGLRRDYIIAQVKAFGAGQRGASYLLRDVVNMQDVARAAHGDETAAAAAYYAALPYRPWIRVAEVATVPVTAPSYWGWTEIRPGPTRDPIGVRIVEVAEDRQRSGMGDPHAGFVAYVPPGSIGRGKALAAKGVGGQPPCAACHGADLKGTAMAPPLAGRSPTYLARQLWDLHTGARRNAAAAPMVPIANALEPAGIVDLTAYLASLKP